MLDANDITQLRVMFGTLLEENNHILKREIRDETYSIVNAAVYASEQRMMQRMDEIQEGITDVINEGVLPQIEEHRLEIVAIKQHIQFV